MNSGIEALRKRAEKAEAERDALRERADRLVRASSAFLDLFNMIELSGAKEQQWWSVKDQIDRMRALTTGSPAHAK